MNTKDKEFFAQSVHKYIVYQDIEASLKKYENRLQSELSLRNLPKDYFQDKIIVDIGTGFQSIIASKMGAKFVYHLDQSSSQVSWMQEYCEQNSIDNIKSIECDITKGIPIEDSIDLVLVFGIWHHLSVPTDFIDKLIPKLNPSDSSIWLRIYRSGSWSRWLVENLREISTNLEIQDIKKLINIRYPYSGANQYKGDLLDDLFAPIWQAFHPSQFEIDGVSSFVNNKNFKYNFDETDENFRVDFNLNESNIKKFKNFDFPNIGINQTAFSFEKEYEKAQEAQVLLNDFNINNDNIEDKIITLYELVRKKFNFDIYTQSYLNEKKSTDALTYESRLDLLLELLKSFKKEN